MVPETLKQSIRAWKDDSGLSAEDALVELARIVRSDVTGVEFRSVKDRGTAWPGVALKDEPSGAADETEDEERERLTSLALKSELPPEGQRRLADLIQRRDAGRAGEQEALRLRSLGLDPDKLAAAMKAKDAGEYAAAVAAKGRT